MTVDLSSLEVVAEVPAGDTPVFLPGTTLEIGRDGRVGVRALVEALDDPAAVDADPAAVEALWQLAELADPELGDPPASVGRAAHRDPSLRAFRTDTLAEFQIRADGEGRTVEAYAVPWDEPAEVVDVEGHYFEVFRRGAFSRQLARSGTQGVTVLYNHGLNMYARPSDRFSVPIGTPREIREDGRGLFTATRYASTELGDEILQLVRDGALTGQSVQFIRSPGGRGTRRTKGGHSTTGLDLVERHDVRLIEYGPTPRPVYAGAAVVGLRARQLAEQIALCDTAERARLIEILTASSPASAAGDTPDPVAASAVAAEPEPSAAGDPPVGSTRSLLEIELDLAVRRPVP